MTNTGLGMLIFAIVGAGIAWQHLRDARSGRDVLGTRGGVPATIALLAVLGALGAVVWASDNVSVGGVLFWTCLLAGAQVLGFAATILTVWTAALLRG